MQEIGWILLGCVAMVIAIARHLSNKKYAQGPLVALSNFRFDPPLGSELCSHTPVHVTFDYDYTNSDQNLYVWASISSDELKSTYQGSQDNIEPGRGEISRYFYLKEAGHVSNITVEVKNTEFELIYQQALDVDFTFTLNEEMAALAEDGVGARIVSVSFSHPETEVLQAGTTVYVDIEYDVESEAGVDIWAIPVTDFNMTYEGSNEKVNGQGRVTKYFTVSEACHLESLRLVMSNAAGENVYSGLVDVSFKYQDNNETT